MSDYLTIDQAAERYDLKPETIRDYVRSGDVRYIKIPGVRSRVLNSDDIINCRRRRFQAKMASRFE